jgi:hypothetical protein
MTTSGKIKSDDLRRFVKAEISPRMGSEWVYLPREISFIRFGGYSIQEIAFSEFQHAPRFRVYYALQSLAIPERFLHVTIGNTLKGRSGKKLFGLIRQQPREAWFNWDTRLENVNYIMGLISEQVEPPINQPLTPKMAFDYIDKNYLKKENRNPVSLWMAGVLLGELGRFTEARQLLSKTVNLYEECLRQGAELVKAKKLPEEAYLRDITKCEQARETLTAASGAESFTKHCQKVAEENIKTLNLETAVDHLNYRFI